ncbi:MAG TPA: hypothetical protein VEA69_09100 [Tepidisphaeraceae bacterium]|nr:hypothetical protein [Tepidisphaeraceae bacterium]
MSEEAVVSVSSDTPPAAPCAAPVGCPPPAPAPERREFDPRARLLELAAELVRSQNRRLLAEYLRLRRATL